MNIDFGDTFLFYVLSSSKEGEELISFCKIGRVAEITRLRGQWQALAIFRVMAIFTDYWLCLHMLLVEWNVNEKKVKASNSDSGKILVKWAKYYSCKCQNKDNFWWENGLLTFVIIFGHLRLPYLYFGVCHFLHHSLLNFVIFSYVV